MPSQIGTAERPLRVAVVGAGPSGFYAIEAVLGSKEINATCDLFDRLPTPYGLVRGGVPDHQNIKKVIAFYEKIALNPRFRFFGHVKLGVDITVEQMRSYYDAIIYAVGNESDRKLDVPGEDLPGVHSATELVGWYNGHPDFRNKNFGLHVENAAVIGLGNVAVDVTRILAKSAAELHNTDIADYAVEAFKQSKLHRIYWIGRRGPVEANFTPKEIRELAKVENAHLQVSHEDAEAGAASKEWLGKTLDKQSKENLEFLEAQSKIVPVDKPRHVILKFRLSPKEFIAGPDGRVAAIKMEKNVLVLDEKGNVQAKGTGETFTLEAGLVFKAVGYRGIQIPGVPFDAKKGNTPNVEGRVIEDMTSKKIVPGEYVVGWSKRGPSGLIGDNRGDSINTVKALLEDFKPGAIVPREALEFSADSIVKFLNDRKLRYVTFADWKKLDAEELARGKAAGKLREKFQNIEEMLEFLGKK